MSRAQHLPAIAPADHVPHPLHHEERTWPESNCYVDLWIEVLHALGLDPHACLPFTLGLDFEGDQWTFGKPALAELYDLYGIDVQELSLWRSLDQQVAEQVGRGRLVLPEVDSFFLPDTRGTDYKTQHGKTTIAIAEIDVAGQQLGYFHNGGYYQLAGADFAGLLRVDAAPPGSLPPYVEFAKLDRLQRRPQRELVVMAVELVRRYLSRQPQHNPLHRFGERFAEHLDWLFAGSASFHAYAFVTLRQLGAASELASSLVRWLAAQGETGLAPAAAHYESIATAAKALQLKTARAASSRKPFDAAPLMDAMAAAWTTATGCLHARYGSR